MKNLKNIFQRYISMFVVFFMLSASLCYSLWPGDTYGLMGYIPIGSDNGLSPERRQAII